MNNVACNRCKPPGRCTCGDCLLCGRSADDCTCRRSPSIAPPPAPERVIEQVDHPAHYQTASGLEAIDVIEAFELGFLLGNAVKYVLRAGKKRDALTDLRKARWYLDRAIKQAEGTT